MQFSTISLRIFLLELTTSKPAASCDINVDRRTTVYHINDGSEHAEELSEREEEKSDELPN